jgi:hypothetical protein
MAFFQKLKDKAQQARAEFKEKRIQEKELKRQAKKEEEKIYFEERGKFLKDQARERAKQRAKGGSTFQSFAQNISNNLSQSSQPQIRTVTSTKKVKIKSGKNKGKFRNVQVKKKVKTMPKKPDFNNALGNFLVGSETLKNKKQLSPKDLI